MSQADFQTSARLVEVYATVTDGSGGYVDALDRGEFTVLDNGKPVSVQTFRDMSGVSVALLLDGSGSMITTLPALKKAALALIGDLRPIDWVAVYSFSTTVSALQPLTTDKDAARQAVQAMAIQERKGTSFYDALLSVSREMTQRSGRKLLVAFTDGGDNMSLSSTKTAIRQARKPRCPSARLRMERHWTTRGFQANLRLSPRKLEACFSALANPPRSVPCSSASRDYLSRARCPDLRWRWCWIPARA